MTTDPPETRVQDRLGTVDPGTPVNWGRVPESPTWAEVLAEAKRRSDEDANAHAAAIWQRLVAEHPEAEHTVLGQPPPKPERDPSNLNDPKLQRWFIAFSYLLVLALLGTCVAGGMCLAGAFQRCDCEESDGE